MANLTDQQIAEKNAQANANNLNNTITPSQLTPATPVKTVNTPIDTTNYQGIISGVSDSIANQFNDINSQYNDQQNRLGQSGGSILDTMNELLGKTADQQKANEISGVNTETANLNKYAEQLAGLNAQATSLNREAQAIPIQTQQNLVSQGRIASDVGIAPENAGALRLNALKALSIAQQSDIAAAAATGSQLRLQAAKDKAQQIVDLKYKPLEDALAIKKQQYELNKDLLMTIDKKRTEALNLAIQKEEREIAQKKELDKYKTETTTTALAAGAPKDLVDAASKASSTLEVAKILGKYSPETLKYELLKEQIKTEKAQRANINSQIAERANKALTTPDFKEFQIVNAGYADRINQSNQVLDSNVDTLKNMNYAQFKLATSTSPLASRTLSPEQKQVALAMRNFITAKLRKESGASIAPSEFADARAQYFPTLGDDETTIANKKALRDSVLNNLVLGSGGAYQPTQITPVQNKFQQATGDMTLNVGGTSIIGGVAPTGELSFKLPGIK